MPKRKTAYFASASALADACNAYFDLCDRSDLLYSEAGLALYLSHHNENGTPVTLQRLRDWYDGEENPKWCETVRLAYLRIQEQIECDPRYRGSGMVTRSVFLNKQKRLGNYNDKGEAAETKVNIICGKTMDEKDFL